MDKFYTSIEPFIEKIDDGLWVEIGTASGSGSTEYFSKLAVKYNRTFYSVDADEDKTNQAKAYLSDLFSGSIPDNIKLITSKGEDFFVWLSKNNNRISLCFLDNFDWNYWLGQSPSEGLMRQINSYHEKFHVDMNNMNSSLVHLVQAMQVEILATDNSIIVCDDTWLHRTEGIYSGKCSAAIPYLIVKQYRVFSEGMGGVLLGRFI